MTRNKGEWTMNKKFRQNRIWLRFTVIMILVLLCARVSPVRAAALVVTTTADELNTDGLCSLREAVANANADDQSGSVDCAPGAGHDTITFGVSGTIVLGSALTIDEPDGLTIRGPTGGIIISGNHAVGVLQIFGGTNTLAGLTIVDGSAGNGGGIFTSGTLTVSGCTFSGNASSGTYSSSGGGAIYNSGTLTVLASTFSGNSAVIGGGGIRSSGTLTVNQSTFSGNSATDAGGLTSNGNNAHALITNSTFSGNAATGVGGGFGNVVGAAELINNSFSGNTAANTGGGIFNNGTLTVTNSTLSGNSATNGGGSVRNSSPGTTTLRNSIVAGSSPGDNCSGTIGNGGNNLDSGLSCGWGSGNGSLSSTYPALGPLEDNGGPTQTFALLPGSPAVDAVTFTPPNSAPSTDQRGYLRPVDGDADGRALVDIGAYEYNARPGYFVYLPVVFK
jgi:CSLREA domain-containing protein